MKENLATEYEATLNVQQIKTIIIDFFVIVNISRR